MNSVGKFFLRSKTVWGALIAIVFSGLAAAGIDVPKDMQDSFTGVVFKFLEDQSSLVAMIGGIIALIGRFVATNPITIKFSSKK